MAKKNKNTRKTPKLAPKRKARVAKKRNKMRFVLKWLFVLGLWCAIILLGVLAWYGHDLPSLTKDTTFDRETSILVKGEDGQIIGRYGDVVGQDITIDDLPSNLISAVLATEDRRFYTHFGIDPLGLARAAIVNYKSGRVTQGGSTITQQLAKNMFLSRERTLERKIQEAMLAIWLEVKLTKDEILATYLNRVYFGGGTYGVDGASRLYFKKPVKDITLREAATLAGLLKAPSRYSPIHNPGLSRQRTQIVLGAMVDAGYITADNVDTLSNQPPRPDHKPGALQSSEKYYADWIVDGLDDIIGAPSEDIIIETTYNANVQKAAELALRNVIQRYGGKNNITQGSVVVMRPYGAVVAMVGGYNYADSQFNRASQALRQPGSSFKPFVYLTALEQGYTPYSIVHDNPIKRGRYRPKNFANRYYGETTLSDALMRSLNTIAFKLIKDVGAQRVVDTAKRLGITAKLNADPSLSLGTSEVTPLEITAAYATIANGGFTVPPYGVKKITSADGELYYERPPNKYKTRVINANKANELTLMMRRVVSNGTGKKANFGVPAAGKTGTTQESRDAWFIGFTDRLVTSVWLGNDDNSPMNRVTGGSFPASIWRSVMRDSNGRYSRVRIKNYNGFSGFNALLDRLLFIKNPIDENVDINEYDIEVENLMDNGQTQHRQGGQPRDYFSNLDGNNADKRTRESTSDVKDYSREKREPRYREVEPIDDDKKEPHERKSRYN